MINVSDDARYRLIKLKQLGLPSRGSLCVAWQYDIRVDDIPELSYREENGDLELETLETWTPGNDSSVIPCNACKIKGITQEAVIHCLMRIMEVSRILNLLCENVGVSVKPSSRNLTELQQEADEINRQLDEALARKVISKLSVNTQNQTVTDLYPGFQ